MRLLSSVDRYRTLRHGVLRGALGGLAAGDIGPIEFNPPRYPRDAQARDLERIGGDMYAAFQRAGEEGEGERAGEE